VVQDLDQPEHLHLPPEIETDVQAIKHNFITIVPLQFNMTCTTGIFGLKDCGIAGIKINPQD
jgi:5'-nucleotidase